MNDNPYESPQTLEDKVSNPVLRDLKLSLINGCGYGLYRSFQNDNLLKILLLSGIAAGASFATSRTLNILKEYNYLSNFRVGAVAAISYSALKFLVPELPPQELGQNLIFAGGLFAAGFMGTEVYKRINHERKE